MTTQNNNIQPLVFRDVTKQIGTRKILKKINLNVATGEVLVLLGPNGAGKTSLLRSACDRVKIDSGEILLNGLCWQDKVARQKVGFVPQSIALYSALSLHENLEILGRLMKVPKKTIATRIEQALQWSELKDRESDLIRDLSGGMQNWVNILASTLHEPNILLLDEPGVGIDLYGQERLYEHLLKLKSKDLAVLVSTHDLGMAKRISDRLAFMVEGEILALGTLPDLIRETYGNGKEISLTTATPAQGTTSEFLHAQGLKPQNNESTWMGVTDKTMEQITNFTNLFEQDGNHITSIKISEPSLENLFFNKTGQTLT